jgi:hypothetical protein
MRHFWKLFEQLDFAPRCVTQALLLLLSKAQEPHSTYGQHLPLVRSAPPTSRFRRAQLWWQTTLGASPLTTATLLPVCLHLPSPRAIRIDNIQSKLKQCSSICCREHPAYYCGLFAVDHRSLRATPANFQAQCLRRDSNKEPYSPHLVIGSR